MISIPLCVLLLIIVALISYGMGHMNGFSKADNMWMKIRNENV